MTKWAFLNDDLIDDAEASLHYKDLSFQRGYGIFDFLRLKSDTPVFLEDHLDRFYASANGMHLTIAWSKTELVEKIVTLISKNNQPDSGIRLSLTGGYSEDGYNIGKPNIIISQHGFTPPTPEQVIKGIRLFTYPHQRQLPQIKSIDYQMAVWLQPKRVEAGADDILYHLNGQVSECPRSNFFLVTKEDKILTPANNVLGGITRKKLLELAEKDFMVEEKVISLADITTAKEAFITSTTKQVLPVCQIDDTAFSQTEISRHLLQRFRSVYMND